MSLRARLIATLLALAAAGLLVLAAITYATQRSFLEDRVDDQTHAALPALGRQLDAAGARTSGAPAFGGPGRAGEGAADGAGAGRGATRPEGGPGPDPAAASLPPGTYGQRREAGGKVLGTAVLSYGQDPLPAPALPADLHPGEVVTVGARGGGDLRYRVRAEPSPGGNGLTIVAIPLNGVQQTLDRLLLVEGLVIAGVLLVLAALAWVLVRAGLRPLERIGETADAIASGELSRRVEVAGPRTEVGRLGLALNAMLERLDRAFGEREASERRLRQFLSDASHELRTPLASIRGYAELFRIGAASSRADTEKAMGRIEDEAARMGVLVDDLLTLARLDETRDTALEPVDLAVLAQDAVADARAVSPGRAIGVVVESEVGVGDADAVVLGDPDRLRQVLANLLGNALAHTPRGTAVEVTVRRAGADRVEIEVRDHGPGLPAGDGDAVFGRFWRAEPGRERGRAGAGLGLAIVAGIVGAHGGAVEARDAPGGGASFVVRLPVAAVATPAAERQGD